MGEIILVRIFPSASKGIRINTNRESEYRRPSKDRQVSGGADQSFSSRYQDTMGGVTFYTRIQEYRRPQDEGHRSGGRMLWIRDPTGTEGST